MEELGKQVEIEFKVRLSECDPYGIAHNSNFFSWFEMGRFKYAQENGYELTDLGCKDDVIYATLKTKCKFIKSCKYDDEIVIKTKIKKNPVFYAIYTFEQVMYKKSTGEILAKSETENAAINKDSHKIVFLKNDKSLNKLKDKSEND